MEQTHGLLTLVVEDKRTDLNPFPHITQGASTTKDLSWILTGVKSDGVYMESQFTYECLMTIKLRAKAAADKLDEVDLLQIDLKAPRGAASGSLGGVPRPQAAEGGGRGRRGGRGGRGGRAAAAAERRGGRLRGRRGARARGLQVSPRTPHKRFELALGAVPAVPSGVPASRRPGPAIRLKADMLPSVTESRDCVVLQRYWWGSPRGVSAAGLHGHRLPQDLPPAARPEPPGVRPSPGVVPQVLGRKRGWGRGRRGQGRAAWGGGAAGWAGLGPGAGAQGPGRRAGREPGRCRRPPGFPGGGGGAAARPRPRAGGGARGGRRRAGRGRRACPSSAKARG